MKGQVLGDIRKRILLFSLSFVSDTLLPHGLQHVRLSFTISRSSLKLMPIELMSQFGQYFLTQVTATLLRLQA